MFKTKNNENGFSAVEVILVLVIVVLIGVIGYLVYKDNQPNTNGTVATSNVTNKANQSTGSGSSTSPTQHTQYMTIASWGVKLPLTGGLVGSTYKVSVVNNNVQAAAISVPNSMCGSMAKIFRGSAGDIDPTTLTIDGGGTTFQANHDKQINGYYYSFMTGNASTCFAGEPMVQGTGNGVQTEAVYSQLRTAFSGITAVN